MLSILAGIVALSLLIVIHEGGHFVAARWAGMHVDRFSIFGIGAPICRLGTWRGTEFVISAIPFGAYVHIAGMDAGAEDLAVAGPVPVGRTLYRDAGVFGRIAAILGGPLANYGAAMVIMVAVFSVVGVAGSPESSAVGAGIRWPIDVSIENLRQIGLMISGAQEGSLAGPVGIVDQLRQSADRGLLDFVVFMALISTVIGMTNLLPLPALDGGRLMFLLYEAVVRRPIGRMLEERIHLAGMVCLLCLILVVTVREVYDRTSHLFA